MPLGAQAQHRWADVDFALLPARAGTTLERADGGVKAGPVDGHTAKPDYTIALRELQSQAASITLGQSSAKASAIVLFDPNCGYCKVFHKLVEPAVQAGELRVTYVPVAILGPSSEIKAAGLLAANDPGLAVQSAAVGAAPTSNDRGLLNKITLNTVLMRKHGFLGTPGVLYTSGRHGHRDIVHVANGVPRMTEFFGRLGISGRIDELRKDPTLVRFIQ